MKIQFVINRNNRQVKFDSSKILESIFKASLVTQEFNRTKARELTLKVNRFLNVKFNDPKKIPTIEEVAEATEEILLIENYIDTAKAFMRYRQKREETRYTKQMMKDVLESVDEYVDGSDWRIKANSNQGYSVGGLILNISGQVTSNFWLSKIYPKEISNFHREGDFHIHDLDMLAGYSFASSVLVKTKEYGNISIGGLAEKGMNNKFTVFSKNENGDDITPIAFNARKTGILKPLIELEFEDGTKEKFTPDHKFLLTSGEYKEAQHLTFEDDIAEIGKYCSPISELNINE